MSSPLFPPLACEFAAGGGGDDGLAEALQQCGDAVEAFAAGVHAREQAVEFVGDAFLFGERGQRNLGVFKDTFGDVSQADSAMRDINQLIQFLIDGVSEKTLLHQIGVEVHPKDVLIQYRICASPNMRTKRSSRRA